jgi:hypothetical protein
MRAAGVIFCIFSEGLQWQGGFRFLRGMGVDTRYRYTSANLGSGVLRLSQVHLYRSVVLITSRTFLLIAVRSPKLIQS